MEAPAQAENPYAAAAAEAQEESPAVQENPYAAAATEQEATGNPYETDMGQHNE